MFGTQLHADSTQCRQPVWHEAFAARLVDGRLSPIRNYDLKAVLAGRNRGS